MAICGQKVDAMLGKNKSQEFYLFITILVDDCTYCSRDEYH